jgi:uncharacterized OsmC-like protein
VGNIAELRVQHGSGRREHVRFAAGIIELTRKDPRMDAPALRALQAPLKDKYRNSPEAAVITLRSQGSLDDRNIACKVETGRALAIAGLHPATGGSGEELCSGDMLLEALVACAGVTLKAVATALEIPLRKGMVTAEGDLDFRGTLGVEKTAPVGFRAIRLAFELDTDASQDKIDQLLKLTERYCVVLQTLNNRPQLEVRVSPAY